MSTLPDHVTRARIEKLFSRLRAQYKKVSFEYANVDMQSEEAFEIARRGAPRPKILGSPIVYNLALKKFETPHFALSMQVACENGPFLRSVREMIGPLCPEYAGPHGNELGLFLMAALSVLMTR